MSAGTRTARIRRTAGAALLAVLLSAHVGTDDVFFAGEAGPWTVRVSIRQPGVIPGLADISVRVEEPGAERVTVTARRTAENGGLAPPPDDAQPVRGETGLFAAQLWLMVRGSHEVVVTVSGAAGEGVARIPVVAAANKQLAMERGLAFFVMGGGLFLVIGLLTIVGAASRESVLLPGQQPGVADRRRAWRAVSVAAVLLGLVLFGGWTWVRNEAAAHRARLDRPWASQSSPRVADGRRVLDFTITEPLWVNRNDADWRARNNRYRRSDLIPDHGKMMHMFVVREPDLDAFAHIHPERVDNSTFRVAFPPLPAGTYRVYADITHEDGYSHTLANTVVVPGPIDGDSPTADTAGGNAARATNTPDGSTGPAGAPVADRDDAWWMSADVTAGGPGAATGGISRLPDESVMRWVNAGEPLVAGTDVDLVFELADAGGAPVPVDPYMGMGGHAMLNRLDGDVFIHLHPTGMISMAAQARLNETAGEATGMAGMAMAGSGPAGVVRFPTIVPDAGRYRIWVQVRRGDRVLTGQFDATVVGAGLR